MGRSRMQARLPTGVLARTAATGALEREGELLVTAHVRIRLHYRFVTKLSQYVDKLWTQVAARRVLPATVASIFDSRWPPVGAALVASPAAS